MAISTQSGVFVKEGKTLDITIAANGTAVKCGDIKVIDGCNCLALWDIPAGTSGSLHIMHKGEVVKITTDEAIGQTNAGVAIYLDENGVVTKSATHTKGSGTAPNTLLGYTRAAVISTDLSFEIVCA